jgi:hypothetical protein
MACDDEGSFSQPSASAQVPPSPTPALMLQVEDAHTEAIDADRDTPLGAPVQVGCPKRQRAGEAELGSRGPTRKHPCMVASQ